MSLDEQIKTVLPEVISWRRALHKHPELSFEEHWTSAYVEDHLKAFGNIEISRPTETSVLGIIRGTRPGKKIGLRADMDGLPVKEEREDIDFVSEIDGKMHACGHDGHTAILLVAAQVLSENIDELHGEVYLIFQHAEELFPGGAGEMAAAGLFDKLDFIYGQHLFTPIPTGNIGLFSGPNTSNSDRFRLKIQGKGGHASQPENSIDPVIVGNQIINQFQTIVSRMTSPLDSAVISTTNFHAGGDALNIIPDSAELGGSVRTLTDETRHTVRAKIEKAAANVCDLYGADYALDYQEGYASVINDEKKTEQVRAMAVEKFGDKVFEYSTVMGGEDFSAFSRIVPSTFAWIGAGNPDKDMEYPHHHPKFGIDEDSFIDGLNMMVHVAFNMTR